MIEAIVSLIVALIALFITALPGILLFIGIAFLWKKCFSHKNKNKNKEPIPFDPNWKWDEGSKQWESPLNPEQPKQEPLNNEAVDYKNQYQAKQLFTRNEWYEHKKLRDIAARKGLVVCPKVRLLDIVEPVKGQGYMTRFHKVQAKHVDFVITDQQMHIKAIVELDDNSHYTPDRIERDKFVDAVLTSVGYKVIHARSVTDNIFDQI